MNTHFALDPQKYVNLPSYAVSTNCRAAVGSTGQINSLSSDQVCQCILCAAGSGSSLASWSAP